jgi:hypothetical protein
MGKCWWWMVEPSVEISRFGKLEATEAEYVD